MAEEVWRRTWAAILRSSKAKAGNGSTYPYPHPPTPIRSSLLVALLLNNYPSPRPHAVLVAQNPLVPEWINGIITTLTAAFFRHLSLNN